MRECKPSDIQALQVTYENIRNISTHIARLNGELTRLYKELGNYINEQQEPIDVQTTHGFSAGNE